MTFYVEILIGWALNSHVLKRSNNKIKLVFSYPAKDL